MLENARDWIRGGGGGLWYCSASVRRSIIGAFEEFGSVAEREVPCYLPGSFTSIGPDRLNRNIAFIADLDSFCYR